jgi:hypothetical protein
VFAPCRWWGVSRPLRELEKSERLQKDLFFMGSSQWHSIYEECVKWLGMAGDVMFEWKNKVMPGKGAVIYGVTKSTMVSLTQLATGKPMGTTTPRQGLGMAWAVLKEALINVEMNQPMWFGSMCRKTVVMRRWGEIQTWSYDNLGSPSELSTIQSIAYNLKALLLSDEVVNVERIKHGWKSCLVYGCNQVQDALDRIYAEEYGLASDEDFYTLHTENDKK